MENDVDKRVMTQPEKRDYILKKSSEYFGIALGESASSKAGRKDGWSKKRFISLALTEHTAYSLREIASMLGYSQHGSIIYHTKTLSNDLSDEAYADDKVKRIYNEYMSYLNL